MTRRDNAGWPGGWDGMGGVVIRNCPGNLVGGTPPPARNVISGNKGDGGVVIRHSGSTGISSRATTSASTPPARLRSGTAGRSPDRRGTPNTVGGVMSNMGNVISGTEGEWPIGGRGRNVWITGDTATGNLVAGNFIGTNAAGDGAVQSTGDGVELHGKSNTSAALRWGRATSSRGTSTKVSASSTAGTPWRATSSAPM